MIGAGPGAFAPTTSQMRGSVVRRVLVPLTVLWVGVVVAGLLVVHVIALDESAWNNALAAKRTPTLDTVTAIVSSTTVLIATCLIAVAVIWWQSRQWWFAMLPALALNIQALVFLASSLAIGRARPDVEYLDEPAPTSSFPSGHAGAGAAIYVTVALCATRIRHAGLRIAIYVVCAVMPLSIGVTRIYRGMHHPTDVIVGLIVGATCAVIAWRWAEPREGTARS